MSNVSGMRTLKRQASSSGEETTPVKQARTSVQNTHARRLPPLRRSDSQALDINATKAVIEHLPPNVEPVPVPSELHLPRGGEQDMAGSTDSESQDENGAWDRRAKAHRHAMLFKRPREPQPKIMIEPHPGAAKINGVAVMDGSDSDSDNEFSMGGEVVAKRVQQLMALRAARAAAPKRPRAPAGSATQSSSSATPNGQTIITTTTRRVTRTSSRTTVTTSTSVAQPAKDINSRSITSRCPTHVPSGATARVAKAPSVFQAQAGPSGPQPQRQNSRVRQSAIDAIAGHGAGNSSVSALTALSATSSLSSMPSLILRRSRRNQATTSK